MVKYFLGITIFPQCSAEQGELKTPAAGSDWLTHTWLLLWKGSGSGFHYTLTMG